VTVPIHSIPPLDAIAMAAATARQGQLTKPPGALGRLEALSIRLAGIQGRARPSCEKARVVIFAGDHGVAAQGVSAFPAAVTAQMCLNFAAGGAAVNVLARQAGAEVEVVDVAVAADLPAHPRIHAAKVLRGTADFTVGPAMTTAQCAAALAVGRARATAAARDGCQVLVCGEMGIANTTSAAALYAGLLGLDATEVCGRGTGIDDAGLLRKRAAVAAGLERHRAVLDDPQGLLTALGGGEIAAMAGAFIGAAEHRLVPVVDGFIATAAAAVAARLAPGLAERLVFAHRSAEAPHAELLRRLGGEPLLDLGLRLGEGTGGVLALHVLRAACRTLDEMATFADAGVSSA
jgi:nicotinate-nucleotide--dimethylbenzimidazole phosphoribosyltransferase